jgi:transposase-like protein
VSKKSNTSKRYTAEFKRDAVALVYSSGKTVTEVAREIGVSPEGLRNWVNQDKADQGQGPAASRSGHLPTDGLPLARPIQHLAPALRQWTAQPRRLRAAIK